MIEVRIEDKPAFQVAGRKTYITGQDNEQFGAFWAEAHSGGLIDTLRGIGGGVPGAVTQSDVLGVSRVEKDPSVRAFDFYIAAECREDIPDASLESFTVPACEWAIFSNTGEQPGALIDAEMYAFTQWLPASAYRHANAPELEVYPARDENLVEFWLPLVLRSSSS